MNLYKISQDTNNGYDTYDSAIVAAESEQAARFTSPDGYYNLANAAEQAAKLIVNLYECPEWPYHTWAPPDKVKVELLGTANPEIKAGVIVASFNAG